MKVEPETNKEDMGDVVFACANLFCAQVVARNGVHTTTSSRERLRRFGPPLCGDCGEQMVEVGTVAELGINRKGFADEVRQRLRNFRRGKRS